MEAKYSSKYDKENFGWNLRFRSGILPEVLPWVIKAHNIANGKVEGKKKRMRDAYVKI